MIKDCRQRLPKLLEYVQIILKHMCHVVLDDDQTAAVRGWARWKEVSETGMDTYQDRELDYGNLEYNVILGFFHHCDPSIAGHLDFLKQYWLSLGLFRPEHAESPHGISMKGDIIEICLSALRAHDLFRAPLEARLLQDGLSFPLTCSSICVIFARLYSN